MKTTMKTTLPDGEWLVSGGLLYRLKDGVNCDEINVTMAAGVRDDAVRQAVAVRLQGLMAALSQPILSAVVASDDSIAKSKRILALVDAYHDRPTQDTRTALRKALMDEFDSAASEVPNYTPEYSTITDHNGKVTGVHWVNADKAPPAPAQPVAAIPEARPVTPKDIEDIKDILLWPVTEDDARAARDMLQSLHFDLSMSEADALAIPEAGQSVAVGHPIQPLITDEHGRVRFKKNAIVRHLVDGKMDELSVMDFPPEDWEQLAQLIGYSLEGFATLPYVTDATYARAAAQAALATMSADASKKGGAA